MKGTLILVVGLPGSGKGTLIKHAKQVFPQIAYPVSWTTRPQRPSEINGEVYHFVSDKEFDDAVAHSEFLEWVEIDNGRKYGTRKKDFVEPLSEGKTVLREVEVRGARALIRLLSDSAVVTVFVRAGNWEDLRERMRSRAPMGEEELAARKARYEEEMHFVEEADYVLENEFGKLEETKQKFEKLIRAIIKS